MVYAGASMLCVGGSGRAKNQNAGRLSTNAVAVRFPFFLSSIGIFCLLSNSLNFRCCHL